ncbi:increased DNA methylation 2-like protein [Cinnamomum micranthum f. kanehirae]|uniref:Increased DNA methylation 2-like protein n=1 Tax=Cinnamomum micranthum f. kanehirae TaxID=337451 RepID=A0A443PVG1_9MAGN|nr:increased DNA methylation 2-like protein [Cinnamomum micranthum f. kanehirae]
MDSVDGEIQRDEHELLCEMTTALVIAPVLLNHEASTSMDTFSMDRLFEDAELVMPLSSRPPPKSANRKVVTDDQKFLLLFIMGTYFGPDLKDERPIKSVFQRLNEGLLPYTAEQLAGSHIKTVEVERVYYYVLSKAHKSLIVKPSMFHQFLQGALFSTSQDSVQDKRQFPDLFPLDLHQQVRFKNRYKIIENIAFINHPEISYIALESVQRFKMLTGLEDVMLDRDATKINGGLRIGALVDVPVMSSETPQKRNTYENRDLIMPPVYGVPPYSTPLYSSEPRVSSEPLPTEATAAPVEKAGPALLYLPTAPTTEEWNNMVNSARTGIELTGSIAESQPGPLVGSVAIGTCDDAYYFRVSLPGVKKDENFGVW